MTRMTQILAGTALAGMMALPAAALTVEGDAGLGLSLDLSTDGPAVSLNEEERDGGVSAQGAGGVNSTIVTTQQPGATRDSTLGDTAPDVDVATRAMVDTNFIGDPVLSADGQMIGTVDAVADNGDGMQKLVISLDQDVIAQMDERRVALLVDGRAQSDGEIRLGWTKAEFESQVDDVFKAEADSKS